MTDLPLIIGPCPECGLAITHRQVAISVDQIDEHPSINRTTATLICACGWMNSIDISGPVVPSLQSALNPIGRDSDPPDRPNGCLVGPAVLLAVGLWFLL